MNIQPAEVVYCCIVFTLNAIIAILLVSIWIIGLTDMLHARINHLLVKCLAEQPEIDRYIEVIEIWEGAQRFDDGSGI